MAEQVVKSKLASHHVSWLRAHPHRTESWLRSHTKDGFDVHHIDGDKGNESPENLVLIEHTDHMMLHGGRHLGRLKPKRKKVDTDQLNWVLSLKPIPDPFSDWVLSLKPIPDPF